MGHGLARQIINNDSVDIAPGRGSVDELLRFLRSSLSAIVRLNPACKTLEKPRIPTLSSRLILSWSC